MNKLKISKEEILNITEWIFVFIVGIYMITYGVAKPLQFGDLSDYSRPINQMDPMSLMWAFYSFSKAFTIVIGAFEVLGAILLIIPKTRLLGGLLLTFILCNIILQDYFFLVNRDAMANAVLYQVLILFIFYRHWEKIIGAFNVLKSKFYYKIRLIYIPIAIIIALSTDLLLYVINQLLKLL